jgi:hypothetical protein
MNTYLVFLRFQLMRGALSEAGYAAEIKVIREFLAANASVEHWQKFNAAWK